MWVDVLLFILLTFKQNTLVLFRGYNNNHGNSDNDVDSDNQVVIVMITMITRMIIMM